MSAATGAEYLDAINVSRRANGAGQKRMGADDGVDSTSGGGNRTEEVFTGLASERNTAADRANSDRIKINKRSLHSVRRERACDRRHDPVDDRGFAGVQADAAHGDAVQINIVHNRAAERDTPEGRGVALASIRPTLVTALE